MRSGEAASAQLTTALQDPTAPGATGEIYNGWSTDGVGFRQ